MLSVTLKEGKLMSKGAIPLVHLLKPEENGSTSACQSCALTMCNSSNFKGLLFVI